MEIANSQLNEILLEFDRRIARKIKIIAVGGTALTLTEKKASTKDVDFCFVENADKEKFQKIAKELGYEKIGSGRLARNGILLDCYSNGYIFCVQLPKDYAKRAVPIKTMQKIELCALCPMDLLITKAARFSDRDKEDMTTIIRNYEIDEKELVERWKETMQNSVVRDADENIALLLDLIRRERK